MQGHLFTIEDANRALPLARAITGDAVRAYRAAKREIRAWEWLRAQPPHAPQAELDELDARIGGHLEQLRRLTDELEAMGAILRDYERGVVDFPAASLTDGGFVFYCWILGESTVSHWHGEDESHHERRLVEAGASA